MALFSARAYRIGGQTLTLIGRFRSLSAAASGSGDRIKAKDSNPLLADPIEKSGDDEDSFASYVTESIKSPTTDRIIDDPIDKSEEEIKSLASYVTARLDENFKFLSAQLLLYGAEVFLHTDFKFCVYPKDHKYEIMRMVVAGLTFCREVDRNQVYQHEIYYQSMMYYDDIDELTKDFITSRVLKNTQLFPKINTVDFEYEVTPETHFFDDLGFDKWEVIDLIIALQMEFKLYIPYDIVSCKLAIEYIYEHRMERLPLKEFENHIYFTVEFGESKSEFRRIFVPGVEIRIGDLRRKELHCQAFSLKGFKPFKYFNNMKHGLGLA